MNLLKNLLVLLAVFMLSSCLKGNQHPAVAAGILPGAWQMDEYLPMLSGKRVAITGNHTSLVGNCHLVDTLLSRKVNIVRIFGPEHGFRGDNADGETITNTADKKTGIPVISLYGEKKKPSEQDLEGIDIMIFDIQDVGCRFYTYISTLTYMMEACAENGIPMIVLDRPNPNGFYVDGPVLEREYKSFVGLHPVPIVYGMTIGEYAMMLNGEGWLVNNLRCKLKVIKCRNYKHDSRYQLPVSPSPNLPDMTSVYLYPSLCLFEGTIVSVGRGTQYPFQVIGHPDYPPGAFSFLPESIKGVSENPPFKGKRCFGLNLNDEAVKLKEHGHLELSWLLLMYNTLHNDHDFFIPYFDKLSGTGKIREQVIAGKSATDIRNSWKEGLANFMKIRKKYLLYEDFN